MPRYMDVDAFRHRILCQRHNMSVNEVLELISTMPTADVVERKKGKWHYCDTMYHCDQCHSGFYDMSAYCPNCGADMREETEDECP